MTKSYDLSLALSARLATITIANGYGTDIGLRVFRGKKRIGEEDVPCVVIHEGGDKIGDDTQSANMPAGGLMHPARMAEMQLVQRYFFEGFTSCDPEHPNDAAHVIIGDLKRALFGDGRDFGGLVRRLAYKGRTIGNREDGADVINASIVIDAEITETLNTP